MHERCPSPKTPNPKNTKKTRQKSLLTADDLLGRFEDVGHDDVVLTILLPTK